jgi:hypothetical protein
MGELILIFAGVGDAMVCLVVMLAPREFFWLFFLWGGEKEDGTRTRFCFGVLQAREKLLDLLLPDRT